jgi:peptidoglycan biosynthesis protein MviN/MurJ (putative lipid II flippase)
VAGFSVAIILKVVAFRRYGIEGLAVAASLYYLLNAAVLLICLRRRTRRVTGEPIVLEELASL